MNIPAVHEGSTINLMDGRMFVFRDRCFIDAGTPSDAAFFLIQELDAMWHPIGQPQMFGLPVVLRDDVEPVV